MKIAIDVSPLQTGHKVRGVGFYLQHLKDALLKNFSDAKFVFFTNEKEIPSDIDVIHYPYFDPFFLTLPLLKKAKTVVTVHDLTPLVLPEGFPVGLKGRIRWEVQKVALRRTEGIITDSRSSKNDVERLVGLDGSKVHVAHLAAGEEYRVVTEKAVKDIKKKYALPEKFALYVGDVTWNKNLSALLESIKDTEIPLVMVGKAITEKTFDVSNPWNADRVRMIVLADANPLVYRLGFLPTEDVVSLYNAATVFVMPSLYEGFGLPVIEAMQCGTPVVTGTGGSLKEVAGDAAFLVNSADVTSLREGIQKVYNSESLQKELRKKGLLQAKKFTWKKTAEETFAVYAAVAGK